VKAVTFHVLVTRRGATNLHGDDTFAIRVMTQLRRSRNIQYTVE